MASIPTKDCYLKSRQSRMCRSSNRSLPEFLTQKQISEERRFGFQHFVRPQSSEWRLQGLGAVGLRASGLGLSGLKSEEKPRNQSLIKNGKT